LELYLYSHYMIHGAERDNFSFYISQIFFNPTAVWEIKAEPYVYLPKQTAGIIIQNKPSYCGINQFALKEKLLSNFENENT
jgi:hypothetical protein